MTFEHWPYDPVAVYRKCYAHDEYRMRDQRSKVLRKYLSHRRKHGEHRTFLDVSCGLGESLSVAAKIGYDPFGVDLDVVPHESIMLAAAAGWFDYYEGLHTLPRFLGKHETYDIVSCQEVLEHLPTEAEIDHAIGALFMMADKKLWLTVSTSPDRWGPEHVGYDLHLTVRTRNWWVERVKKVTGHPVRVFDDWIFKAGFLPMEVARA